MKTWSRPRLYIPLISRIHFSDPASIMDDWRDSLFLSIIFWWSAALTAPPRPAPPLPSRCLHPINNCPLVTIDHLHTEQYTGLVAGRGWLHNYKWKHTKLNLFLFQMCSGGGWRMEEPNLVFTAWCTNKLFVNVYKIYISLVWKTHTRVLFSQKSGLNINL